MEAWVSSPSEPFTTHYLAQIEIYQKHLATAAFKLAGGVDPSPSSSKPAKQGPVPQVLVTKITKAFLDGIYNVLDGMVLLASNESPIVNGKRPDIANTVLEGLNPLEVLDLQDSVRKLIEFS